VIENTQRDVNIALINELAIIFNKLDVDTLEILEAAGTKWNFLSFRPGLVGGHCIGVDPYYLTHKSESVGYRPEMILAGRRINDGMGVYVVSQLIKKMINKKINVSGSRVLIMGLTFKENCPDIRNTKIIDIVNELQAYEVNVSIIDPWCDPVEAANEYGLIVNKVAEEGVYDALLMAVAHDEFKEMGVNNIRKLGRPKHILYDLKYVLPKDDVDIRL
jgi:UDP-N-acetyl-D-galactosamine dehydrogenase